ncbi:MAG: vitamin B12-dependent ribonucleotide reductase [Deltaproteobacteria bacterium]|nr:vitamin B12-dependent ribonucleotide reductase [Deltaproteobacteria bacterium]
MTRSNGLKVARRHTVSGANPLEQVEYTKRRSVITNPDGSVVFQMDDVEVPASWSQLATDIVVSKYFRKRGVPGTGHEVSVRQVVHRIARTIRTAGETLGGYFATAADADAFEAELSFYLIHQYGAFNSPVWFNCGLYHEYGINGSAGNWFWNPQTDQIECATDAYRHPQCSACFIQRVDDDLMSIFELAKNEARLFKYGSGTGTNFSRLRGKQERLSGGGTSSGLMSFLEVLDRGAGATKSGGTTRRAAKMVCLDIDHPEVLDFIGWKVNEEKKVRALIAEGFPADYNGEAYRTVSGQNSNNSVRIPDAFMEAYLQDGPWSTRCRTTDAVCDTVRARELMCQIAQAAWVCADPGVQFDSTINKWHTCKNTDRIYASNPCSEFMFLDDTACNLASLNLMKFYDHTANSFDLEGYRHAIRVFFIAQEILVDFSSYPTKSIAKNSHDYRPLGLGYANLGTMLMVQGIPYDSPQARAQCAALTAILTGHAYTVSAEMADTRGPFSGYAANRDAVLDVIKMHRQAACAIDETACPAAFVAAAKADWDAALAAGERHGYRNAQATVLAPTGTIGLLMDCDTTGIEPDYALVKFKKLAGGGYFKIINQSIPAALKRLGYADAAIDAIVTYVKGTSTLVGAPHINTESLRTKGLTDDELATIEAALPGVFDLGFAVNAGALGEDCLKRLGISAKQSRVKGFHLLKALGFTAEQIEQSNRHICGMMTIEGAPGLKPEHLPIFDCANPCGKYGKRFIQPMAHITIMSAAQKFISGAISKTINVPHETTAEAIEQLYIESWRLGLKAVAIYRDGSKMAQPLATTTDDDKKQPSASQEAGLHPPQPTPPALAAAMTSTSSPPILQRRRLPKKRRGFTQEARVGGHKVYLRTGEYADGALGEIFIDMHKEGAALRSMMNCFAIAVSLGLQYGVPLEEFVNVFTFTRFEPSGITDHPNVRMSTSVIDFIFRVLGMEYLGRTDFVQVKPEAQQPAITSPTPAVEESIARQIDRLSGSLQAASANGYPKGPANGDAPSLGNDEGEDLAASPPTAFVPAAAAPSTSADGLQLAAAAVGAMVSEHLAGLMGDAPFCDQCGHVTVRSASCYKCVNCGNSMGCS